MGLAQATEGQMKPQTQYRAITTGKDLYGLRDHLQRFADEYWLPDHVSDEQGAEIILDAFKRKIAGDLELLDVSVDDSTS